MNMSNESDSTNVNESAVTMQDGFPPETSTGNEPKPREEDSSPQNNGDVLVIEVDDDEEKASDKPLTAPPLLMNRFSSWRKQASTRTVANLFRRNSSNSRVSSAAAPIQSAALSPAARSVSNPESNSEENLDDAEDDETASSVLSSSVFTESDTPSRPTALQWAAASVVGSVQQNFRGRYNTNNSSGNLPTAAANKEQQQPLKAPDTLMSKKPSQTSLILSSAQASHLQNLQGQLDAPCHYVMLLGRGMLGVNLKQAYLMREGVYVDFLVRNGSAERSGVIWVGDSLVQVGSVNVQQGTIWTVPQAIAAAPRPVHLVLSTAGTQVVPNNRMTYVDVCVGLLHHYYHAPRIINEESPARSDRSKDAVSMDGETGQDSEDSDDKDAEVELVTPTSFDADEDETTLYEIPLQDSIQDFINPVPPPLSVCEALATQSLKRNNEQPSWNTSLQQAVTDHVDFRHALRNALILCVMDGRRFPFLAKHMAQLDDSNYTTNSNAMLMLFLEMVNFSDLWPVTSPNRRSEIAQKIAHKYFLPTRIGRNELVPPMFDFHTVVSNASLRQLEANLRQNEPMQDLFVDFQRAVADELSLGRPFVSFLVSNECARMRAYLRNTAPFVNFPLAIMAEKAAEQKSYWLYCLTYLLCLTDKESFGETEAESREPVVRMEDAATGLAGALVLKTRVLPVLKSCTIEEARVVLEQLWEIYLAPGVGCLSHHGGEIQEHVTVLQQGLRNLATQNGECTVPETLTKGLQTLGDELLYEYASTLHSKFRGNKIHEWLCEEFAQVEQGKDKPQLPDYCVKRLLRKTTWPAGIAPHKPSHDAPLTAIPTESRKMPSSNQHVNAECAVVFGSVVGLDLMSEGFCPGMDDSTIRRYTCQSLYPTDDSCLRAEEIIPTLESYALIPEMQPKPFQEYSRYTYLGGWGISLVNFMIPRADVASEDGDSALYGVSLVVRQMQTADDSLAFSKSGSSLAISESIKESINGCPKFSACLRERPWAERIKSEVREDETKTPVVGIILVSQRNVILGMREALSLLVREFAMDTAAARELPPLVNVLGNFAHKDIEPEALPNILTPFIEKASAPWLERPIGSQKQAYEQLAGQQLIKSLPPIPLALLFITALLEQKIVLSSSRRSILLSASVALSELLKPLKWCHLLVPLVPTSLAADLLQYPAPYILGMPSEDPGVVELIRDLPPDVTLVDLDVGRVILAPSFAHDSELGRGTQNNEDTARALRSQVLFLAQSLGNVFGPKLDPPMWLCDSVQNGTPESTILSPFDELRSVCHDFVTELLTGVPACCYWFDEDLSSMAATASEPTILFDEDRFFHIKNIRQQNGFEALFTLSDKKHESLALSLENFDLVLELFLRCQSMNAYIGTRRPENMAFSL